MFYPTNELKLKVDSAPFSPGVYIYRDEAGEVLYVGKAVVLRNRTKSYFINFERLDPKIKVMVEQIRDVEYVTTDSEVEALLLETNLIKKYKPKYNRLMKDDKNYIWVMIAKNTDFPKVELVREKKIKNADYFGPYPNTLPIRRTLRRLRHVFPYRSCSRKIWETEENGKKVVKSSDPKPCLYFYLGLCNAPCAGNISKNEYGKGINDIKRFFRGEKGQILTELKSKMSEHSGNMEFESAAVLRDKIDDIQYVTQTIRIDKDVDEFMLKGQKDLLISEALKDLIDKLDIVSKLDNTRLELKKDFKIETYDISNIQGTNATASMVVLLNGKPEKSLYRKFKIKTKSTTDDFEMMREVFRRRFVKRIGDGAIKKTEKSPREPLDKLVASSRGDKSREYDESFDVMPDLVVVDGGKGQLSAAYHVFQDFGIDIPVIGLAKREEEIFKVEESGGELDFKKVKIARRSRSSYLLQNIRDEAHRFALGYHRKLRSQGQTRSALDEIPGIGKVIKIKLLKAFGSADGIKKAKVKDLLTVVRNRSTVEKIKKLL